MGIRQETRSYNITSSPGILNRFERLLAMLHWNGRWGHSGIFGMSLDGDGDDGMTVYPEPESEGVSGVARAGEGIEMANDNGFHWLPLRGDHHTGAVRHLNAAESLFTVPDGYVVHIMYSSKGWGMAITGPDSKAYWLPGFDVAGKKFEECCKAAVEFCNQHANPQAA